jgi:hypothetical protein
MVNERMGAEIPHTICSEYVTDFHVPVIVKHLTQAVQLRAYIVILHF